MIEKGLNKLYWGFLFIMLSFKIQGFDILPDIIGYLFFASGFIDLASSSAYFNEASKYNIPMIVLSIFSVYERPVQGGGIHLGAFGVFGIPIAIAAVVLNLLVVYNLFMGIKDMAKKKGQAEIVNEADKRWEQYKLLKIAAVFSYLIIFIPPLAVVYITVIFVITVILTIVILGFIKRCSAGLRELI